VLARCAEQFTSSARGRTAGLGPGAALLSGRFLSSMPLEGAAAFGLLLELELELVLLSAIFKSA